MRIEPHAALNPLVSIWLEPRATLRFILSTDESLFVHTLAVLAALAMLLSHAAFNGAGDLASLPAIMLFAVCAAMVVGVIQLYLLSAVVTFAGSFFNGRGRFGEVRAAIAWGAVPMVLSLLLLWTPCLLIFGPETFTSDRANIADSHILMLIATTAIVIHLVLVVWSLYITVAGVAEAHQITLARGGFTLGLAWLICLVTTIVLLLAIYGGILIVGAVAAANEAAEAARIAAEPLPDPLYTH